MRVVKHKLGLLELYPTVHNDHRGHFKEAFNLAKFNEATQGTWDFVQDNESLSRQGVLRGMHYQLLRPQGKLVRVSYGQVFDVAADLRRSSPTFGQWHGVTLSEDQGNQFWIPPGFAHGFFTLSTCAILHYKTTDYYYPEGDRCIKWDDKDLDITWPNFWRAAAIVSDKDAAGTPFKDADAYDSL